MTAYELRLLAELIAIGVMEVAPGGKSVRPTRRAEKGGK
jgi:hypothetical protein